MQLLNLIIRERLQSLRCFGELPVHGAETFWRKGLRAWGKLSLKSAITVALLNEFTKTIHRVLIEEIPLRLVEPFAPVRGIVVRPLKLSPLAVGAKGNDCVPVLGWLHRFLLDSEEGREIPGTAVNTRRLPEVLNELCAHIWFI